MCTKIIANKKNISRNEYKTPEKPRTQPVDYPADKKKFIDCKVDASDIKVSLFTLY